MATPEGTNDDYLGMSDEDFLNINGPAEKPAVAAADVGGDKDPVVVEAEVVEPAKVEGEVEAEPLTEAEKAAAAVDEDQDPPDEEVLKDKAPDKDKDKVVDPKAVDPKAKTEAEGTGAGADKDADKDKPAATAEVKPVDYEGFFKEVMKPFKANGREFTLKSPDEAIRLMQMGAGYGRKLQDLQPALKTIRMLEKADLLDEGKLSFLIDINNKNPDAIKKLIADSGIDPLDLNIGDNVSYTPTNHAVSDKEMVFQSTLKDVESNQGGMETIRIVNQTWDQQSKSALWEDPAILKVIQSQRENGIYAQIVSEIDRRKLLGDIPDNTPFLQAYKFAGDHLKATNGFVVTEKQASVKDLTGDTPQPQVIETRAAAPKAQVQNGSKAAAAASPKTIPSRKTGATVNPLEMADDDFLKTFKGRL